MCSEEELGFICTKDISCCYDHVEWGSLKFLRAGMKLRLQDDEKNAAENKMMIKTAKPRDANISRFKLVVNSIIRTTV